MTPQRIQRRRTKGWRMPPNTVYVGRGGAWGNPFKVGVDGDAAECVRKYAAHVLPYTHQPPNNTMEHFLISSATLDAMKAELAGKNLACWCSLGAPCHADLLLKWANEL